MMFDPSETHRFRTSTERVTKQPGILSHARICSVCNKKGTGMKKVKGTGTSRFNPLKWQCKECEK